MKYPFRAIKVTDTVYWVGAIDWTLAEFHGYATPRGTTYNAFLILGDEPVLIDVVKAHFKDELLSRIASVIDPGEIQHIISNHSEMDHTGCLLDVIERINPKTVYASKKGVDAIHKHFGESVQVEIAENSSTIELGNRSFTFEETRMVHWPDSMFTLYNDESILFSNDAFGMHLASSERFDDEVDEGILREEAAKYFANILMPFAPAVAKTVGIFDKYGIPKMIAPDHGPVWRTNLNRIISWYLEWAHRRTKNKALIVYDTMWGSTAKMTRAIEEGLMSEGVSVKVMPLSKSNRAEIALEVLDSAALLVGSPNLNSNLFPTVADTMAYLQGLAPKGLIGAAFGSYGWSTGGAIKKLETILGDMKVEIVASLAKQYVPDESGLDECFQIGATVGKRIKMMKLGKEK
ncbi:FprA family A-type flavoprotein [bacterium]|nr:FprA family A-type flavoprotein [bacterium]